MWRSNRNPSRSSNPARKCANVSPGPSPKAFFDNAEPTTLAILFDFAHDLVRKVCTPRLRGGKLFRDHALPLRMILSEKSATFRDHALNAASRAATQPRRTLADAALRHPNGEGRG